MQWESIMPSAGIARFAIVAVVSALAVLPAAAQENYQSWEPIKDPFPSTGGGGIMIGGYKPVVVVDKCRTDFTATEPGGTVYYNMVEFDAVPVEGGILCTNGKWRARDGSASGTTPYRVFIKDGVSRGSP
jgi:hypothetical protein